MPRWETWIENKFVIWAPGLHPHEMNVGEETIICISDSDRNGRNGGRG